MKKKQSLTILLSAVIMTTSLVCGTVFAKRPTPPPTPVCGGLTGTWHGEQPGDIVWLAIHTSDGLDPTKGEMLMNWINTQFLGPGVSLTPGHGVWQLNSDGDYNYTWYAFAIGSDGAAGTLRASGVAKFNTENPEDCNTIHIYYQLDYFDSVLAVGELATATPLFGESGYAYQARVPLVVTPLPEQ